MKIRVLTLGLPALALGLACMHSSKTASSAGTNETGAATASTGATSTGTMPSAGTGATGQLKGHASDQVITGRVAEVTGQSLTIESSQGDRQTLGIADQTVFRVDGRDAHATDLAPGQDVRASFNEVEGRPVAVKVEAGQGVGATTSPGAPAGTQPSTGSTNDAGQGGTSGTQAPGTPSGGTPDTSGQKPGSNY